MLFLSPTRYHLPRRCYPILVIIFILILLLLFFFLGIREAWAKKLDSRLSTELVVGTGISAYKACRGLAMLDDQVLDAIDFSYSSDIWQALHDMTSGELVRLTGYTAEQVAASKLAAMGHVVSFPDSPNQPGWDLLVDGHPVQVKCTLDPHPIEEHMHRYPDIPVVANKEAGGELFSHVDVVGKIDRTLEGVEIIKDIPHHIPLVTLFFSLLREGSLVLRGKETAHAAAGHVVRDVTIVGGTGVLVSNPT